MDIRDAHPQDALDLARLMNLAGEGIPFYLWSQDASGADPLTVGIQRAQRESAPFSYRNARVMAENSWVLGMLLGYPLPDTVDGTENAGIPALVAPLMELEALAAGCWYVNAVATYEEQRGRGVGYALMQDAERRARRAGCRQIALIVAEENCAACTLYRRCGYQIKASRPMVPYPGVTHGGNWLLMIKPLSLR
jgi:ribosomal protein S18 acetylase RimI-like enzyme